MCPNLVSFAVVLVCGTHDAQSLSAATLHGVFVAWVITVGPVNAGQGPLVFVPCFVGFQISA